MQESLNQKTITGVNAFSLNGVALHNPYDANCCDETFNRVEKADFCNGDSIAGVYGYSFWGGGSGQYGMCRMGCDEDVASDIVGVARDGFPIYGPMQYYSSRTKKIYLNQCSDCALVQINGDHVDACGGIEVGDGSASDGTQYRYIATAAFPYYMQCYRGDLSDTEEYFSGNWRPFRLRDYNSCDVNDFGVDESCFVLSQSYAQDNLCGLGTCVIRDTDLSSVYFTCSDKVEKPEINWCGDDEGTTTPRPATTTNRTKRPKTGRTTTPGTTSASCDMISITNE